MADEDTKGEDKGGDRSKDDDKATAVLDEERVSEWLRENKGIENIDGLTSALESERKAAKDAKKALRAYDGVDPEEYQRLKEAAEQAEAEQLQSEGKWEEMKDRLAKAHEKELEKERSEKDLYKSNLEKREIRGTLLRELGKADVIESHREKIVAYLLSKAPAEVRWEDGEPVGVMGDVTIPEYVESWAQTDDAAEHIASSGASGSGAKGGSGGGAGRKPYGEMTEADKVAFIDKYGKDEFLEHMMATK